MQLLVNKLDGQAHPSYFSLHPTHLVCIIYAHRRILIFFKIRFGTVKSAKSNKNKTAWSNYAVNRCELVTVCCLLNETWMFSLSRTPVEQQAVLFVPACLLSSRINKISSIPHVNRREVLSPQHLCAVIIATEAPCLFCLFFCDCA